MALTVAEMAIRIDELVNRNCVLEEEAKTLKLKNLELMSKVEMYERNGNILVGGQERKMYPTVTKVEEELKSLKLENLEMTVKFQMKKIWEFVLDEMEKRNSSPGKIYVDDQTGQDVSSDPQIPTVPTNPLEMKMIVRRLIGFVYPEDLLNCRQVCKLWNEEAKDHMEEKLTFHIHGCRLGRIKTFLSHASQSFPSFRNLKFILDWRGWQRNKNDVDELFKKHGKFLHHFQLDFKGCGRDHNWNLFEFRDIVLNSLEEIRDLRIGMSCRLIHEYKMYYPPHVKKMLPNLTTLNLGLNCSGCNLAHLSYHGRTQVFTDLLGLFPNLETLHWWSQDDSRHFIQSLLLVNPPKLEHLIFLSKVGFGYVERIAKSELKLKEIYLVEFQSFGLHLLSPPGQSGVTPKRAVYYNRDRHEQYSALEMKNYLEDQLTECGQVSCAKLLQVVISALDAKFNRFEY